MNGRERGPQFCTGRTEPSGTREAARQRGGVREGATGGGARGVRGRGARGPPEGARGGEAEAG
jgi:hypothetical protein